jgi:hypothetical protein
MQYLLLIYGDESQWRSLGERDSTAMYAEYSALTDDLRAQGKLISSNELRGTETATTVRVRNDEVVTTDGPFAETKEVLGGYYLIEAKDLDQALAIGKACPAPFGGVEVRPVMVFS